MKQIFTPVILILQITCLFVFVAGDYWDGDDIPRYAATLCPNFYYKSGPFLESLAVKYVSEDGENTRYFCRMSPFPSSAERHIGEYDRNSHSCIIPLHYDSVKDDDLNKFQILYSKLKYSDIKWSDPGQNLTVDDAVLMWLYRRDGPFGVVVCKDNIEGIPLDSPGNVINGQVRTDIQKDLPRGRIHYCQKWTVLLCNV